MSRSAHFAAASPQITVRNLQRKVPVKVEALQEFAERARVACAAVPGPRSFPAGAVGVVLVSDRRIAALHRQFMNVSGPTDVITFQHGEILISAQTAQRHARRFGSSFVRELQLYIVHGLLHLRGWDDQRPAEARRMQVLQEKILRRMAGPRS